VDDMYSRLLFIALCRQEGATVYRRPRQRVVTICVSVRATASWRARPRRRTTP